MKFMFCNKSVSIVFVSVLLPVVLIGLPSAWAQSSEDSAMLPTINVSTEPDKPTDGYAAKKSFSATRTDTPLRDVPQSITVITHDLMRDQSIQSITEAIRYVPGVVASMGEGNRDAVVMRGNSRTTGDFYVDGLRDDVQYFRDLYNIDRIEVLKGSNGMIFGRGGAGGVINRVTKEADWHPVRTATAEFGSYNHKRFTGDVSQPINDMLAARLNGIFEQSDSFRDESHLKRWGVNPTLTILPTEKTKVILSGEYFYDRRTADRGIPSFGRLANVVNSGRPAKIDRSTFFGDPDDSYARVDSWSLNSLIEHTFDNGIKVRNRTRYADYDKIYQNIYATSSVMAMTDMVELSAYNNTYRRKNLFNQTDLIFKLDTWGVNHEVMTGVEYGRQSSDNFRNTGEFANNCKDPGCTKTEVPFLNPRSYVPVAFKPSTDNHGVAEAVGIYLQDQITIIPQLKAVLGIRYDNFDMRFTNKVNGDKFHTNDGLISPRAGLIFKPIDPLSIYANYSLAYVPRAGDQLASLNLNNETLRPEKFRNLELGAKWDIRPDLALTAALYQLDRSNVVAADPNDPSKTILVDGQRSRGTEIGLMGKITPHWSVMGGYAYTDAKITKDIAGARKGAVAAEVPKHTVSVWNRYDFTSYFGLGLGVIHRGSIYATIDNTVLLPSYTRVDAAVYVQPHKKVRIQANIENLANIKYAASAHNNNNIMPGAPRIFRLSAIVDF